VSKSPGVWLLAWRRFGRDRLGLACLVVVLIYAAVMVAAAAGWIVRDWSEEVAVTYAPPAFLGPEAPRGAPAAAAETAQQGAPEDYGIPDPLAGDLAEIARELAGTSATETRAATLAFGADKWGRDVLKKAVKGTETSLFVGLVAAALAAFLGTLCGALAGYRGGWIDDSFNWLYSVFTSIPYLLLVLAVAAVVNQKGVFTVILILGLTGWTGIFRLIRAEYMKHKVREYVLAADAIGASDGRRMFVHILPNVSHVVLVQLSLHVVLFIKSEVILSFLGFGVGVDTVSWGSMLAEAQSELILGKWWQIAAATFAMAVLVSAFSLLTDALRDALDPRLK
jgi:peptide/nickel transport system permease protein